MQAGDPQGAADKPRARVPVCDLERSEAARGHPDFMIPLDPEPLSGIGRPETALQQSDRVLVRFLASCRSRASLSTIVGPRAEFFGKVVYQHNSDRFNTCEVAGAPAVPFRYHLLGIQKLG